MGHDKKKTKKLQVYILKNSLPSMNLHDDFLSNPVCFVIDAARGEELSAIGPIRGCSSCMVRFNWRKAGFFLVQVAPIEVVRAKCQLR